MRRNALALASVLAAVLFLPGAAAAHAVSGIDVFEAHRVATA